MTDGAMSSVGEGGRASPLVIGIGASAGGLEALQQFFSSMPAKNGLCFAVVQHLSPDYKSLMAEILGKETDMEVLQAENGAPVRADTVYLIPPKKNMTLCQGRLLLSDFDPSVPVNHPIDALFASLAEELRERAVAVVLSGTGSDGTGGVKRVKERGGLVIAQEPESARFDGMPRSAIATGLVDFVLTPRDIAEEIRSFSGDPTVARTRENGLAFVDDGTLGGIYELLRRASGINFTRYKRGTVLRRIERRMMVTHSATLSDFTRLLAENENEAKALAREILIGVTSFFRDAPCFEALKQQAIVPILERAEDGEGVRVWVAGCSTGEEAYSIAILFQEAMAETQKRRDVKIFATDVDALAVEKAGRGVFSESVIDDLTPARFARWFIKRGGQYAVSKEIRKMVVFAPHNMISDPPFGKLDLISCRNVLIYFQPVLQKSLFSVFNAALKKDGYLFLGKSETAGEYAKTFYPVCAAEKIYQHISGGKADDLPQPLFRVPEVFRQRRENAATAPHESAETLPEEIYTAYLERFLPPCVVLNENNEAIHFFGDYADFLRIPGGRVSNSIFHLIVEEMSLVVSNAIRRCRAEKTAVTYTQIALETASGPRVIDLSVCPVSGPHAENTGMLAVLFLASGQNATEGAVERFDIDKTAARRIDDLESELRESQSDLRSTIGELETVNGELQAANEELLTANEELQSANEELQSVNEELYTVNTEYQQKLDELTVVSNDLSNFLSLTMIGILFVDGELNVRKFTEYIGREFQMREHDVGRCIRIFAHHFPGENIEEDARNVLKTLLPVDREAAAISGKRYTLRIAPYRTVENSIRGLVITVIDSLSAPDAL